MAFDGFLKVLDVTGESKDPRHPQWIDVDGFGFSAQMKTHVGPEGILIADDPVIGEFWFSQPLHRGSVTLYVFCVTGKPIPSVIFHARKSSGTSDHMTFFEAKFEDCLVTSVETNTSSGPMPVETIRIAFRRVELIYREQDSKTGGVAPNGEVFGSYDRATGQ
jgi:type VI secretion system secreted protein Hcp